MSAAPTFHESDATAQAAQAGLLYEQYAGRILGFCRQRLVSQEEAEDAVQHTFLNAYRSLRTGTVPRAEAAWLFKIAENVCRERRRSAWRRSRIEAVSDDGDVDGATAAPERTHDELSGLADALAELAPNQRRAILMREWQGLSYREIAAELALTESAVETLLFRARRSLAQKLDRSRARAWGWVDAGSALAWGKSLLGGAALKLAAAAVVVAAGVAVATPSLRHDVPGGASAQAVPLGTAPMAAFVPGSTDARTSLAPRAVAVAHASSSPFARRKPSPAPARPALPVALPTPAPLAGAPAPPPVPAAEGPVPVPVPVTVPVTVPPSPAVEVPPVPALPSVTVPDLPTVPPLPELPRLP